MGLIKKFADFAGVKHEIDPTGHSHTTSEGWLSAIVGSLTSMINGKASSSTTLAGYGITDAYTKAQIDNALAGKAASNHTHTTSESWLSTIVNNLTTLINCKAASSTTLAGYGITDAYTKTQVDTNLKIKVGEYSIGSHQTSGTQKINIDTYLTQGGMAGMFHIYNGRTSPVDLGDLLETSIENMTFSFFGNWKNISAGGQVLCHICRHDNLSGGGWYLVYVISRDEKVTSLSEQSTNLQYPSAKCVYDELDNKANKVTGTFTEGDLLEVDENGDILPSGKSIYDFAESSTTYTKTEVDTALAGKADTSDIPTKTSDLTNDSGFLTSHQSISGKADKVQSATNGNFASLNSNGNLTDSGKKASDFADADHTHEFSSISSGSASVSITGSGDNKQVSINGDGVTGNLVDSTPTANSNKLVKSSGVAASLAGKASFVSTDTDGPAHKINLSNTTGCVIYLLKSTGEDDFSLSDVLTYKDDPQAINFGNTQDPVLSEDQHCLFVVTPHDNICMITVLNKW